MDRNHEYSQSPKQGVSGRKFMFEAFTRRSFGRKGHISKEALIRLYKQREKEAHAVKISVS